MYYVYTSRFQPLNLLIEEELKWLSTNIKQDDKIIIGIVNPNPQLADPGDKADTWTRFKIQYNPMSYWERYCMISSFLRANEALKEKVEMICPLPRPSVNIKGASNYLPSAADRVMCLQISQDNDQEDQKRRGLEKQGETIFEIPSYTFQPSLTLISPELLCCLMALGSQEWDKFVSLDTKKYLEDLEIPDRVLHCFTRKEAKRVLKRIYNRESTSSEQAVLFPICNILVTGIEKPIIRITELPSSVTDLINNMQNLVLEINNELIHMKSKAPKSYETFKGKKEELLQTIEKLKNNDVTEEEATSVFDTIVTEWDKRK